MSRASRSLRHGRAIEASGSQSCDRVRHFLQKGTRLWSQTGFNRLLAWRVGGAVWPSRATSTNPTCAPIANSLQARIWKSTPVGFEPTRGDPIGLAGRRLNRSAKVSSASQPHDRLKSHYPHCGPMQQRIKKASVSEVELGLLRKRRPDLTQLVVEWFVQVGRSARHTMRSTIS